jgi:hypothetical protein
VEARDEQILTCNQYHRRDPQLLQGLLFPFLEEQLRTLRSLLDDSPQATWEEDKPKALEMIDSL